MVRWWQLLLFIHGCSPKTLYSKCKESSQCGTNEICDELRAECLCEAGHHPWSSQCIPAKGHLQQCNEEIQCRQVNKKFRCVGSHLEEGRRCRCKEDTKFQQDDCVPAPGYNVVSSKGNQYRSTSHLELEEDDGGAGLLGTLSKLLGPIGFSMVLVLVVGLCIVYHNAKTYREDGLGLNEMSHMAPRRRGHEEESPPPVPPTMDTFHHQVVEARGPTEGERRGMAGLLAIMEKDVVISLATSLTRGQVEVGDADEAIETILTHVGRPVDLVRRKVVTKEVIFRYLHHQKVPVSLKASENKAVHMARLLEYWSSLVGSEEGEQEQEEFSLEMGREEETVNNTGIQIRIEDATPQREMEEHKFAEEDEGGASSSPTSFPYIDDQPVEDSEDKSDVTDGKPDEEKVQEETTNEGYKYGMRKFFQSISEAQDEAKYKEQEDNKYSHESKESDENSEIKNILSSVEKAIEKPPDDRMSKYIVEDEKASTQQEHMDQDWKIPVLETSESEFEESEYSKAGLSNMGFDKNE